MVSDRSEILRTWQVFRQPGEVLEVRIPKAGRFKTISGYFDNPIDFAKWVSEASEDATYQFAGYYFTINPVLPDLLARSCNRLRKFADTTTRDADVIALHWLPVDLDPKRPADISSTDAEHQAAIELAEEIRRRLVEEMNWPANAFVKADSGNGCHLAVKIDLPNDDQSKDLVERCLKALDSIFSNEKVKVDTTTHNPARIWKIYGTPARKGDSTATRPHRMARLLEVPAVLETVPREKLEELVAMLPRSKGPAKSIAEPRAPSSGFNLVQYAEAHGATVLRVESWTDNEGGRWDLAILSECPFDSSHNRGEARIGVREDGKRTFGCFHDSCKGRDWHALRNLWEPERPSKPGSEVPHESTRLKLEDLTKATGRMKRINPETGEVEPDPITGEVMVPKLTLSPSKAARAIAGMMELRVSAIEIKNVDRAPKLWRPNGGIWQPDGEREITRIIDSVIGDLSYERGQRETLRRIRGSAEAVQFDSNPFLFPALDGVLDMQTGRFRDYKPEDYLTFQYGTAFNLPEADYRPFLWYLCSSLPDPRDALTVIDIITAIALRIPFDIIVLLFGGGSNGKGILEKVILALFTAARATAIKLDELSRSRFGPGAVLNKDVWIVTEVESVKDAMSALKKISTGEFIDSDVKYGERVQGTPHVIPILDANSAFDYGDNSWGRKRRTAKLDFPYTFGEALGMRPIDRHLEEKLTRPEVLSGITRIIAARAPSLIKSRRIYRRKSETEQEEEYNRQRFSLSYFCEDCLSTTWPHEDEAPLRLKVDDALQEYLEYCRLFNVTTPAVKGQISSYIAEKYNIQSKNTSEMTGKEKVDYRYYPGLFLVKSAKLAYGEAKIPYYDSYDNPTTALRQRWIGENASCSSITTPTTEKLLSAVIEEIERMFRFIETCKDPREISYENYLKNPVVAVVGVVMGQDTPVYPTTPCRNDVVEPVVEEPQESIKDQLKRAEDNMAVSEAHAREQAARYTRKSMETADVETFGRTTVNPPSSCLACGENTGPGHGSYCDGAFCTSCGPKLPMVRAAMKAHPGGLTVSKLWEDLAVRGRAPRKEYLPCMLRYIGCVEEGEIWRFVEGGKKVEATT